MNVTVDSASPQIGYYANDGHSTGDWNPDHHNDGDLALISHGTYTSSGDDGDYMTFTFNGTGIYVFGLSTPHTGKYTAALDGVKSKIMNSYLGSNDEGAIKYNYVLFSKDGLNSSVPHVVTLTNANGGGDAGLEIDYIVLAHDDVGKVWTTVHDDFSPLIQYNNFNESDRYDGRYLNNTWHASEDPGVGSYSLRFHGHSVQLFGARSGAYGNYGVSLDNGPEQMFNATWFNTTSNGTTTSTNLVAQQSLFLATGLEDDWHVVEVTSHTTPGRQWLDLDYIVVNSSMKPDFNSSIGGVTISSSGEDEKPDTSSDHTPIIAGSVVGGVVAIAGVIFLLLWFFVYRPRRNHERRQRDSALDLNASDGDVDIIEPYSDHLGAIPLASTSSPITAHTTPSPNREEVQPLYPGASHRDTAGSYEMGQVTSPATAGGQPSGSTGQGSASRERSDSMSSAKQAVLAAFDSAACGRPQRHREEDAGSVNSENEDNSPYATLPPDYHSATAARGKRAH